MLFKKKTSPTSVETKKVTSKRGWGKLWERYQANNYIDSVTAVAPYVLKAYEPAPNVLPKGMALDTVMAQDSVPYEWANSGFGGYSGEFAFKGFPTLAILATRPEIRKGITTIAEEMTRKWIEVKATGDTDSKELSEKIEKINEVLKEFKVRDVFRKAIADDGFFGRSHIYIDLGMPKGNGLVSDNPDELSKRLSFKPEKIPLGSFKGLVNIEPMWCYPNTYNSTNPLKNTFYRPDEWFVFQKKVHSSRLLTIISNPVPDMFKAAFAFGGIATAQLVEPYVNNWIEVRDSIKDTIHSFSFTGLKTNLQTILTSDGGDDELIARLNLYNQLRDNRDLIALDKEEEFFQFNTPLSGLETLLSKYQEQMAAIISIPLVKYLGITPGGLNASSDGEIRVFYDFILALQEAIYRNPIETVLKVIQLSCFGEIDPNITFEFVPLYQLSELEKSQVDVNEATADQTRIDSGVIDQAEARERLAHDPSGRFGGLDLGMPPTMEGEYGEGEEGDGQEGSDTKTS